MNDEHELDNLVLVQNLQSRVLAGEEISSAEMRLILISLRNGRDLAARRNASAKRKARTAMAREPQPLPDLQSLFNNDH